MLWGGLGGLCGGSGTYTLLFSKAGAALDMAEHAEERELLHLAGLWVTPSSSWWGHN